MNIYTALEAMVNEPPADDVLQIVDSMSDAPEAPSFEEYFQDVNDLNHELANDVADADRCIEVAHVLGEVTDVVARRVSEATPTEARLVELVGDMAVAGTDANPEDVVPSMEAYADGASTMKKVKENIAKMWVWLKVMISRIIEKVKLYFKAIFQSSVALSMRLKKLDQAMSKADSTRFKGGKVKLSVRDAAALATGTTVPASLDKLVAQFSGIESYKTYFYSTYHAYLVNRIKSLREAVDKFDLSNPDQTLVLLADRLKAVHFPEVPGLKNNEVTLIGQHRIVTENDSDRARKKQAAVLSAGHYLEVSRKTVVEVHRITDHADIKDAAIEVGNLGNVKALTNRVTKLVEGIEAFSQHPLREIEAHQVDLMNALEGLATKLQAQAEKDQGIKAAEHAYSLISNHVSSVASWIDQPLRAYTTYVLREAGAMTTLAEKAFAQGEAAEKRPPVTEGSQDHKPAGM